MILKNYDNIDTCIHLNRNSDGKFSPLTFRRTNGNSYTIGYYAGGMGVVAGHTSPFAQFDKAKDSGVVVGGGNTAPTYNDYALENDLSANVSFLNDSYSAIEYNSADETYSFTYTKRFVANSAITINEIGILCNVYYGTSSSSSYYSCLVYREVIEGISVSEDEIFSVSLTFTYPANSNKPTVSASVE